MRDIPFRRRGLYISNDSFFPDSRPGSRPAVPPTAGAGATPGIVFGGFAAPSNDMQAVRDQRRTTPLWFLVDLSTARSIAAGTAAILNLNGNTFYADPVQDASGNNAAGYATIHFADTSLNPQGTPLTVGPQFIAKVPFTQLLLENIAQAGKFLRIIYGVDIDFSPGLNASVTIGGTVNVNEIGASWATSYKSTTALAANTPENVFAAASNTGGGTIWTAEATMAIGAAGFNAAAYLMKATAPATVIDGDVVKQLDAGFALGAAAVYMASLKRAIRFASGKRLDYISTNAEVGTHRSALYTLN